ncbi:hypothetical protein [Jannaschia sp. LMIT008]|uniref:hypothetical protein n=1 Tax=Jannaschia maritima TaxID=3032585 RepID=UPI00281246F3|nr:hypothetical protein [Jannaschia sp. LMIT008]
MTRIAFLAVGLILSLSACVTDSDVRNGVGGALVGCAVGEVVDDACAEGAVIGGTGAVVAGRTL